MKWCSYCKKEDHNDAECWCTRAVDPSPMHRSVFIPDEPAGMHKLVLPELCRDPEHNFPSMLHIPAGHRFVHYCPTCHYKTSATGVQTTL